MHIPHYPYLQDYEFLKKFDQNNVKEQTIKITILSWQTEDAIAEIQGYATGGTINLNGSSAARRTGSISLLADETIYNINEITNIISLNKKIEIEVGFINNTNKYTEYKILWFPLGVYIIKNPNISCGNNGITISLTLSDKMSLLNGDVGGTFPATVVLSEIDNLQDDGSVITENILLTDIIRNMVHQYGGIQLGQIYIADIPETARRPLYWNSEKPVYWHHNTEILSFEDAGPGETGVEEIVLGQYVGYINSPMIWPGTKALTCNAGETVVSALDKIKNALGNFEYYFDIYGNFIFHEIKNYLNISFSTSLLSDEENYMVSRNKSKSVYTFDNSNLIISYQNTPQYNNIKNDYIVWGQAGGKDNKVAIRYHLAIDNKPKLNANGFYGEGYYKVYEQDGIVRALKKVYPNQNDNNENVYYIQMNDWRTKLYLDAIELGVYAASRYGAELKEEWPKIYNIIGNIGGQTIDGIPIAQGKWIVDLQKDAIQYYLDFIEKNLYDSKIQDFNIQNIGCRSKVTTNNSINCIFPVYIPDWFFIIADGSEKAEEERQRCEDQGQSFIQVPLDIYQYFAFASGSNDAYNEIKDMLYQYTSYNETISLSALPIYYLEPNTRISVYNKESSIDGDYMIKTISLPLAPNGNMTLQCSKALEKI